MQRAGASESFTEGIDNVARAWVALGAGMLGGCCGLQTRHVAALRAAVDSGAFA